MTLEAIYKQFEWFFLFLMIPATLLLALFILMFLEKLVVKCLTS